MKGAGGSDGGISRFVIGLLMFISGTYLLLKSIHVHFNLGYSYSYGNFRITSGFVMIPFMFGIGLIFYNAKNVLGWILAGGSLVLLIFGVITNTQFRLQRMDAFELITILVLMIGGVGLFLSSFRNFSK